MLKLSVVSLLCLLAVSCATTKNSPVKEALKLQTKTKVIAHRGAWKNTETPENSVAALKEAIQLGCYGSEMDVHMTTDGYLVVNHDNDFKGVVIQKSTLAEVRQNKLDDGEEVPLLSDFLEVLKKTKDFTLVIEIKPSIIDKAHVLETTQKVIGEVKKYKVADKVAYISFAWDACEEVHRLQPQANVQYLSGDKTPDQIKEANLTGMDYHYNVFIKNPDYITRAKQLNLETNAWTVNDQKNMEWMIERGVDYITTNEPEMLLDLLRDQQ